MLPALVAPYPGTHRSGFLPDSHMIGTRLRLQLGNAGIAPVFSMPSHIGPGQAQGDKIYVGGGAAWQGTIAHIAPIMIVIKKGKAEARRVGKEGAIMCRSQ